MDYLKKTRKQKMLSLREASEKSGVPVSAISDIESERIPLGEERALNLAKALDISEDVMTVYRGRLPQYAHKLYREDPEKLENLIKKIITKSEKENE